MMRRTAAIALAILGLCAWGATPSRDTPAPPTAATGTTATYTGPVSSDTSFVITGKSQMSSSADGYMSFYNNAASGFTGLRLGGTTSSFPMLKRSGTALQCRLADDSADAPFSASTGSFSGTVTVTSGVISNPNGTAAAPSYTFTGDTGSGLMMTPGSGALFGTSLVYKNTTRVVANVSGVGLTGYLQGWTQLFSPNGTAAAPPMSFLNSQGSGLFYDSTLGATGLAVNGNETGTFQGGRLIPYKVNDSLFYRFDDCDNYASLTANFVTSSNAFTNTNTSYTTATMTADHPGWVGVAATTASAGGAVTQPITGQIYKTASMTWQWRIAFMFPSQLSTSTNRYVFNVGSFTYNAAGPWAGPYISYSDNMNSGNWVLASSYTAGNLTTTNTAIAVPAAGTWHVLVIKLVNGTYTFTLDGSALGTVVDGNMTSQNYGLWATYGGAIQIIPSSYTSTTVALIDAYDTLITGLAR